MTLTSALFVVMDSIAKGLTESYPAHQITWARFSFHALFVVLFLNVKLGETLRTQRLGLQLLRSSFMLGTNLLFFAGLVWLGLAQSSAIMYVAPLVVTLLSMPILGEPVGWRRILSVTIGFTGALIIIRPGGETFQWAILLPFIAAFCHAGYQLTTRLVARADNAMTTLAYTAAVGTVISSFGLLFGWRTPDLEGWIGFAAMGLVGCLSHFTFIKAFTAANAAVVAPFGYLSLLWATLLGFLLFGELPDTWTIVGALVIVASGLYILHRERTRKRRPVAVWRPSR